jgi:hypothetical protein
MSIYAPEGGGATNLVASILRPEPPRADPSADRLSRGELLRDQKWTEEQFSTAGTCGFPLAAYRMWNSRGGSEPFWSRQEVQRWVERVRSLGIR